MQQILFIGEPGKPKRGFNERLGGGVGRPTAEEQAGSEGHKKQRVDACPLERVGKAAKGNTFLFIGTPVFTRRGFTEQIGGGAGQGRFGTTGFKQERDAECHRARLENIGIRRYFHLSAVRN